MKTRFMFAFGGAFVLLAGIAVAASSGFHPVQAAASFLGSDDCDGETQDDAHDAQDASEAPGTETDDDANDCGDDGDGETADDAPAAQPAATSRA